MTGPLVASPMLPADDLVLRWRAWKDHTNGIGAPALPPFEQQFDAYHGTEYLVPEAELTWAMLEIERLRAAIEGLVKTGGGRQ